MMNEHDELQKAIQEIEPPAGAKERMLKNIYAKAQAQGEVSEEAQESSRIVEAHGKAAKEASKSSRAMPAQGEVPTAASESGNIAEVITQVPSEESKTEAKPKKKISRWNARLLRAALPAAACLVLAVISLGRFVQREPILGDPPGLEGDVYSSPYVFVSSPEELENLLKMPFPLPAEASEISCSSMNDQIGYVTFLYQDHFYELTGSKEGGNFVGELGTLLEEDIIDSEFNAILSVYDSDGLTVHCISWTDGANRYYLTNMDGCTGEDMKNLYFDR